METGAINQYIDVAQLTLYGFWIFFAGLILYLRSEDKREGYPLESDRSGSIRVQGFPSLPKAKVFKLRDGSTRTAPSGERPQALVNAKAFANHLGAPIEPTGNPLLAGVGPGSWNPRPDVPDMTFEGVPKLVPLRVADDHHVDPRDADPRGMDVIGADGAVAGKVTDLWVDRAEVITRYLEVAVAGSGRRVLVPMNFARIHGGKGQVKVRSLLAKQFADVPGTASPDQVTLLEEEKIMAYYGAGTLYAEPSRQEPLL